MPRLRLLCCRLATTEVGEYEGGMYDRHLCEGECGGCFTAHLCDVVALLRGWRAKEATATTQTSRRGYEARLADEIEALPLDGAAECSRGSETSSSSCWARPSAFSALSLVGVGRKRPSQRRPFCP